MADWIKYEGHYEKELYDIKTINGDIFYECYPNAGTFHTPSGEVINELEVIEFKESDRRL